MKHDEPNRDPVDPTNPKGQDDSMTPHQALDCEAVEELLVDHLEGLMSEQQHASFDAHLATCPACAETARAYAQIQAAYRDLPGKEPSAAATAQVLEWARIEGLEPERFEPRRPRSGRPRSARSRVRWVVNVAAGLLVFFTLFSLLPDEPEPFHRRLWRADAAFASGDNERALELYGGLYDDLAKRSWPPGDPDGPVVLLRLAELQRAAGERGLALEALAQLHERYGPRTQGGATLVLEARLHEELGNLAAAKLAYERARMADSGLWDRLEGDIARLEQALEQRSEEAARLGALGYTEGTGLSPEQQDELRSLGYL
ncbi:MAG: zf-HC2 domain-containing protein [Planctomycetota bacterium]|nr:zf-HC2 domain-containing protein [Planctomycetota bacterium]